MILKRTYISIISLIPLVFLFTLSSMSQTNPADKITGAWEDENSTMRVEISKCDDSYCGKIVWLKEPIKDSKPSVDERNRNPELRNRPLMELQIISDLKNDNEVQWSNGKFYSIDHGLEVNLTCFLIDDNTLELTITSPAFLGKKIWKRK